MKKMVFSAFIMMFSISASAEVDYDDAVNRMNAPYLAYENGVYAMFNAEKECWDTINNADDAERCMAMTLTGAFIESAWAMKQGRQAVPNYQGDIIEKRIEENLAAAKILDAEKQLARENFKKNSNKIIPSMMNVGAIGR
jgi:shikimate kinase